MLLTLICVGLVIAALVFFYRATLDFETSFENLMWAGMCIFAAIFTIIGSFFMKKREYNGGTL